VDEHDKKPPRDGALIVDDSDDEVEGTGAAQARPGRPGDGKAEEAADVLAEILEHMDLDADVSVREDDERVVLDVDGPDAGRAIGKKGQTLDALQFLVNKIVNRFPEGRRHVVVDSGDYRDRHDKSLVSMARREAKRAVDEGKVVTLAPMNARDRRVIHLSLAKLSGVTTESRGEGTQRRIQIIPARGRRDGRRRDRR
jgi:spoIIIJ-associated protein